MSGKQILRVAGVSFLPNYPDCLHRLRHHVDDAVTAGEPLPIMLIREPNNEHDSNAIAVHLPMAGHSLGHIPRAIAKRLAVRMDSGETYAGELIDVPIDPQHPDRPGLEIAIWAVDKTKANQ